MSHPNPKSWKLWFYGLLVASLAVAGGWRAGVGLGLIGETLPGAPFDGPSIEPTAFVMQGQRPSLEGGVGWLNTAGPIRLDELKGKIVLLDFWTYCCINCHHVLPDLAKLEEKYKNELVVIGVHTAKFFAERDTENIRRKVREYGIKHPVVNDADQVIWNRFAVNSWPTLVLLDPAGEYQGALSGEGHYALLDKVIGQMVAKHRSRGDLNETPIKFFPENEKPDNTPLLFPGKVLVDVEGKRLFIADTGHNRIVLTDPQGKSVKPIGSGVPGLVDGTFDKAGFNRPQGMCLVGETLYVADTENHAIRAVDLKARTVSTLAGNGLQSHRHTGSGPARSTSLNSPWDVLAVPATRSLFIAMAGPHQIWRYDFDSSLVSVWAGTGVENIRDGPLGAAEFAQPSGLAIDKEAAHLFVADSEVSGVRAITLDKRFQRVQTIVGNGLFVFDDVDGTGEEVRLQHCLGLTYGDGKLYIADTYNNKIKVCDPRTKSVETLIGAHQAGDSDSPPRFYQPGGLSFAGTHLYVADTNNHKVRVIDLREKTVKTLELAGLTPPGPASRPPSFPNPQAIDLKTVRLAPGTSITLDVNLPLDAGFKLNAETAMPYLVETPGKPGVIAEPLASAGGKLSPPSQTFSLEVPLARTIMPGEEFDLKVSVASFVCNDKSSLCLVKSFVWTVPVEVTQVGKSHVALPASSK